MASYVTNFKFKGVRSVWSVKKKKKTNGLKHLYIFFERKNCLRIIKKTCMCIQPMDFSPTGM